MVDVLADLHRLLFAENDGLIRRAGGLALIVGPVARCCGFLEDVAEPRQLRAAARVRRNDAQNRSGREHQKQYVAARLILCG